jgi:hypothetical protein
VRKQCTISGRLYCARVQFALFCSQLNPFRDWLSRLYENHKAPVLGFLAILCASIFAVWPLSYQCRRKRRRRRLPRHSLTLDTNEGGSSSNLLLVADLPASLSADEADRKVSTGNHQLVFDTEVTNESTPLFATLKVKDQLTEDWDTRRKKSCFRPKSPV